MLFKVVKSSVAGVVPEAGVSWAPEMILMMALPTLDRPEAISFDQ
jgi:hypothetical protein